MKTQAEKAMEMAMESPITKTLNTTNSCIIVEKYDDWEVTASLRVWKTWYTFWPMPIEEWWTLENIVEHMICPKWRKVEIHMMPFNWLEIIK